MIREILYRFKEKQIYHDIIESLVTALEAKDIYTSGHSRRVAYMSLEMAKKLNLKWTYIENIHMAAHLHDIGKIGIPDEVLNKEGNLLEGEWEHMKRHPQIGYDILSKSKKLQPISNLVLCHHERWDGKGYPKGLSKEAIPLGARIIALCDSIDAMTSKRPYRKPVDFNKCMEEIIRNKGKMYDPRLVEFARSNMEFMRKIIRDNEN